MKDRLYFNGKVTCIRPMDLVCEAMLTRGDRIVAVGDRNALQALAAPGVEFIDLAGRQVLPGFIDTHAHFLDTGFSQTKLNLGAVQTIKELLEKLSESVKEKGEWIFAVNLDENRLLEGRLPTLAELDQAIPDNPVYINHRSYHSSLVNSCALSLAGMIKQTDDNKNCAYLSGRENTEFKAWIAKRTQDSDLIKAMEAASKQAGRKGLTTVHCIEGGDYWGDAYAEFIHKHQPESIDLILFYNTDNIQKIERLGLPRMGGDLFLDGSVSGRTASFLNPYVDKSVHGDLYMTDQELETLIEKAHKAGVQISFHVIGDRAIEQALRVFDRVLIQYPSRDHRHRIEHFGFPSDDQIQKAAELGLAIATQPAFVYLKGENYRIRLGEGRVKSAYPLRKLIDAGLRVGGGSDSLVTPMDPLLGIHAAVNAPYDTQRLTRSEAVELYTIRAAELAFEEGRKGSLEAGKLADFVVLEQDIFQVPALEIKDVEVAMTVHHGQCVYQRNKEEQDGKGCFGD